MNKVTLPADIIITIRDKSYHISDEPIQIGMLCIDRRDGTWAVCDFIHEGGNRIALRGDDGVEVGISIENCYPLKQVA